MVIAVDTRSDREEFQNFLYQTFSRITKQYPQHTFIFIFNKGYNSSFTFSEKVIPVVIKKAKIALLAQIINEQKIAAVLKKYKADVFITSKCLLNTKIPQVLIFNKSLPKKQLTKAKLIITSSQFSKQNIIDAYKIGKDKIIALSPGIDETFQPVDFEEREKIKEQYANGNEYFLCINENSSEDNLLNMLKAFSIFKKRQKSNMQLLIAERKKVSQGFLKQLHLYKFKNDVKVLDNIFKNDFKNNIAAPYALISISNAERFNPWGLAAMKCNVPVIVSDKTEMNEICGDAALYVNEDDYKDIAEKMMLIFKNENLRSELIEKGQDQIKKYSWDNSAEQLWASIKKATA